MKMLLIAYNEAVDNEVMEALESAGTTGYTKWTQVLGKGRRSGPHLNSHAWPKANNCLAVAATDETAEKLLAEVRRLRRTRGHQGIKAFQLPLEEAT